MNKCQEFPGNNSEKPLKKRLKKKRTFAEQYFNSKILSASRKNLESNFVYLWKDFQLLQCIKFIWLMIAQKSHWRAHSKYLVFVMWLFFFPLDNSTTKIRNLLLYFQTWREKKWKCVKWCNKSRRISQIKSRNRLMSQLWRLMDLIGSFCLISEKDFQMSCSKRRRIKDFAWIKSNCAIWRKSPPSIFIPILHFCRSD